ncbi:MAG: putative DNA-binding domain-containing protein [Gammaproteobacteria bacterium]|nr:putative DNA-binding domain-containing protein [Gammaproteobacteria bacterium]
MAQSLTFQQQQHELANAIRQNTSDITGIEQRRIKVYQELFFNNVEGFCSAAFPVFKSLVSQPDWLALVRSFFVEHQCETPHFCEIAQEFLEYLFENKAESLPYPYMLELAHYEWAELACSVAITTQVENTEDTAFGLDLALSIPESVMPLTYQYPVHTIGPENALSVEPSPTSVIVYRDVEHQVQFMLVDALSIVTLQLIQQHDSIQVDALITQINQLNSSLTKEQLEQFMSQAISRFLSAGIVFSVKN